MMGISNTYTVRNLLWDINEDIIKPGDVVLVNLTEYGREWLLEDRPDMAKSQVTDDVMGEQIDLLRAEKGLDKMSRDHDKIRIQRR